MNNNKKEGISFMVRARNEESTLENSISSLNGLKIPHEIIIILHLCTDRSEEIAINLAKNNKNIKILKYNIEVSRAGYETLATDSDSIHSFITYSNWCLNQTNFSWLFKWDADFICTPELLTFLNETNWKKQNKRYKISAINSSHKNKEFYLVGNMIKYSKYIFWEVPITVSKSEDVVLDDSIFIKHESELSDIKSYWKTLPWYENETSEEARLVKNRIFLLSKDFREECIGLARSSNPACDSIICSILNKKLNYVNFTS
jgi:glycosyltransferase involved in cell wall biosynthesis